MRLGTWIAIGLACCAGTAQALTTDELLDEVQHKAFLYFWNEANPVNGLIKDRSTPTSPCSIASLGFGLSAICVGIDHGWITREDGRARILVSLENLWNQPQGPEAAGRVGYKGLYYHFLDMNTSFRTWNCELSTIDSALLFAGVIDAKQYFDTNDPLDIQVRTLADQIYYRADWDWARNGFQGIMMGWKPGTNFSGFGQWTGYNEAMILYILALGSPTHPVPNSAWSRWTSGYQWQTHYGYSYVNFPPLFGHQYSHCWIDFRFIRDSYMQVKGITYFENSVRATYAQREYCIDNPFNRIGYGEDLWGLTASDDPTGYRAHGAPPGQNDDGTITPTAPVSSIPFAPEIAIPCTAYMYDTFYSSLWGPYGFKDAFNLNQGWWDTDVIGIDQGPMVVMIENYRTQRVWNRFMQNADVQRGLTAAGFTLATEVNDQAIRVVENRPQLGMNAPNPFGRSSTVSYQLPVAGPVSVSLEDVSGREIRRIWEGEQGAGTHRVEISAEGLPSGVYYYRLTQRGQTDRRACVVVR